MQGSPRHHTHQVLQVQDAHASCTAKGPRSAAYLAGVSLACRPATASISLQPPQLSQRQQMEQFIIALVNRPMPHAAREYRGSQAR